MLAHKTSRFVMSLVANSRIKKRLRIGVRFLSYVKFSIRSAGGLNAGGLNSG